MNRTFRRYHRVIAIALFIPLLLTVITGMIYTVLDEWLDQEGKLAELILGIHTGEIVHLQAIYPILNGLGLIGLVITGLSMTGLFSNRSKRQGDN